MSSAVAGRPLTLADRAAAYMRAEPEMLADPFPLLRELRETAPVLRLDSMVLVSRYDDVKKVYWDERNFQKGDRTRTPAATASRARLPESLLPEHDEVSRFGNLFLTGLDGEDHRRVRMAAHRAFTPRRIAALHAAMEQQAEALLDALAGQDVVDLIPFAYRMPLMMLTDMLGIPPEDRELIHELSGTMTIYLGRVAGSDPEILHAAFEAKREFVRYLEGMLERRPASADSDPDLLADLLGAEDTGKMSTEELTAMFVVLLIAGHETTTALIGNGLIELMRHRDQWQLLCDDPALAAQAVEELLRWTSPVFGNIKMTVAPVELAGEVIEAGTSVFPFAAAANRDPAVFEDPERLDLRRADAKKHIAFGFGERYCIGNQLARYQATAAFSSLSRRFPELELAQDEFEWFGTPMLRRTRTLNVSLGPDQSTAP